MEKVKGQLLAKAGEFSITEWPNGQLSIKKRWRRTGEVDYEASILVVYPSQLADFLEVMEVLKHKGGYAHDRFF